MASEKILQNPGALTGMVRRVAAQAGNIIMNYHDGAQDHQSARKSDGSPVTRADHEAEIFIQKALAEILPGIPFVGEEAAAQGRAPDLQSAEYFWLVDPLDGTRDFIAGGQEFTVNIALVQNGVPVLGVVYVPARDVGYAAHGPASAVRWSGESAQDKNIRVRRPPREGLTVIVSNMHGNTPRRDQFLQEFKVEKLIRRSSSLKICVIAEGKADLYPRFGQTCIWDTAAAHAVLAAAGGQITNIEGKELRYDHPRPDFLNPEFIAAGFDWRGED